MARMSRYEALGRHLYTIWKPLLSALSRNMRERVRVVIVNDNGDVLLVRSWFGRQRWSLPGGGIGRGEEVVVAAVREVREETGVTIRIPDLRDLGTIPYPDPEVHYRLHGFSTRANGTPKRAGIHRWEILEVRWHPIARLPKSRSPIVDDFLRQAGYASS